MEWNRVVILSLLLKKYICLLTATVPCALLVLTHYTANTTYMQRKLRCNTAQWVPLPTQSVDSKRAGNSIGNSIHLGICIIYIIYIRFWIWWINLLMAIFSRSFREWMDGQNHWYALKRASEFVYISEAWSILYSTRSIRFRTHDFSAFLNSSIFRCCFALHSFQFHVNKYTFLILNLILLGVQRCKLLISLHSVQVVV